LTAGVPYAKKHNEISMVGLVQTILLPQLNSADSAETFSGHVKSSSTVHRLSNSPVRVKLLPSFQSMVGRLLGALWFTAIGEVEESLDRWGFSQPCDTFEATNYAMATPLMRQSFRVC